MKRSNFEVLSDGVLCCLTFCGHQILCACYQPVKREMQHCALDAWEAWNWVRAPTGRHQIYFETGLSYAWW